MNASLIISTVALLFYAALLLVVVLRSDKNRLQFYFSAYLATMLIWSLGSLMLFLSNSPASALFWNRFMIIGSTAMPIAFFGFVQVYLMRDRSRWLNLGFVIYALTQIVNFLGWIVTDAWVENGAIENTYGPAIVAVSITWVFYIGFSAYSLFIEFSRTREPINRNRIKYLILALLVIFAGSMTNSTALQIYPVDIGFNIFSALILAYAIFRHQLLDINIVVRGGLLYSTSTVVVGVIYLLIIFVIKQIFHDMTGPDLTFVSLVVAVIAAILVQPLQAKAQSWVDRFFYRNKYDATRMIQRLNQKMTSVLDLNKLTHMILDEVTETMHVQYAGFFLRLGEQGEFYLMVQTNMQVNNLRLSNKHPLVLYFNGSDEPLSRYNLEVMPQFRGLWQQERAELEQTGADLYLPLKTKGELVGIFALGPKRSGLPYSQDDQMILGTLARQMASSIENALLFAGESRRRHEAETLQNALLQLTSDIDLEQVLDNILVNLRSVIPYDSACLFLLQRDKLIAVAGRGFEKPELVIGQEYLVDQDPLFQEIQRTRHVKMIPDVSVQKAYHGYGETRNVRSWMGVPLIARGTVIGCLTVDSLTSGVYHEVEQADLAQAFASHASIAVENSRLFKVEREQRQLAEALREIGAILSTTLDFDNVLDLLLDQLGRVVPYSIANILLVEDGQTRIARTRYHESLNSEVAQTLKTSVFNISPSPHIYYMIDSAQPLVLPVVPDYAEWIESPVPIRSWMGAPVLAKGRVIACFSLATLEPDVYRYRHAELLSVFAGQAALAMQNARLFSEIQQLATVDDLTGVFNRRHLFDLGEREFGRAQRYNRPLAVVMLDLDSFKLVNDKYGHLVGDQVLKVVADRCRSNIREVDILGRFGGEEFTIILPEANPLDAFNISERLRKHVAIMPVITTAGAVKVTISLGVASLSVETPNLTKLIECADFAMYEAKRRGRNIACAFEEIIV